MGKIGRVVLMTGTIGVALIGGAAVATGVQRLRRHNHNHRPEEHEEDLSERLVQGCGEPGPVEFEREEKQ